MAKKAKYRVEREGNKFYVTEKRKWCIKYYEIVCIRFTDSDYVHTALYTDSDYDARQVIAYLEQGKNVFKIYDNCYIVDGHGKPKQITGLHPNAI